MINSTSFTPSQVPLLSSSTLGSAKPDDQNTAAKAQSAPDNVQLSDKGRALGEAGPTADVALTPAQERSQNSADVIVGFINQHLDRLKADGATEEELAQALNDGFAGFVEGFEEAMQILNDSGLLTTELSAELSDTQSRVAAGLEALKQQYAPDSDVSFETEASEPKPQTTTVVSGYQESSFTGQFAASGNANPGSVQSQFAAFAESYQQQQIANLEVLTRDGDKVTISYEAFENYQRSGAYSASQEEGRFSAAGVYAEQSESGLAYSVSVEGELDEGELAALDKLFKQVDSLAKEFFDGDFDRAFAMAMELQIDTAELASMSLDMQQTTSYSVAETYGSVQQLDNPSDTSRPAALADLGQFVQGILDALDTASQFGEPVKLISDLFANRLAQQSLVFPEIDYEEKAQLLDQLIPQQESDENV